MRLRDSARPTTSATASVATVAVVDAGVARAGSSSATLAGSATTTHARCSSTSAAARTPRLRCTSRIPSIPNARVSDRTRDGSTAAQTIEDSASSPVVVESCVHSGSGDAVSNRIRTGPTSTTPSAVIHAARRVAPGNGPDVMGRTLEGTPPMRLRA